MKVSVIKMRREGVAIPKRALAREIAYDGELSIAITQDNRLNRMSKTAKLIETAYNSAIELMDADILWMNEERLVLTGFEPRRNQAGEVVDYAQSWLCLVGEKMRLKTESEEYEEQQARRVKGFTAPSVFPPGR